MSSGFSTLGVSAELVSCLRDLGMSEPYPIQSATLPDALRGEDLFAQSPTGSGKTLAYAIPLVERIERSGRRRPRALVLAPTRELAAQIAEAIRPLARAANLRVATFYGGTGYKPQLDALARGVDVVVGCPGRLIDLLERGVLHLAEVEMVVVDEADRMADMGFLPPVRRLLGEIEAEHQTMLFSATLTKEVDRLVRDHQRSPKRYLLERPSDDLGSRTHEFWQARREERAKLAVALVAGQSSSIVFCRTKRGAERLAHHFDQAGLRAVAIHGDRSQAQRDRALEQFRSGRAAVLVGTDVASRGIHVDGVECVVHFDPPEDTDTYVHRSGRTGRAGASGRVVSFVSPDQERGARRLVSELGLDARLAPPPSLDLPPAVPPRAVAATPDRSSQPEAHGARPRSRDRSVAPPRRINDARRARVAANRRRKDAQRATGQQPSAPARSSATHRKAPRAS